MHHKSPKIIELEQVSENRYGKINRNNVYLEPHEENTITYLSKYGFNIECLKTNNTPKSNNADIVIFGTIWEMKAPTTINESTLKKRMHKASKQADKVIFDLRNIKTGHDLAEKTILDLFMGNPALRRMLLIKYDGATLDIYK